MQVVRVNTGQQVGFAIPTSNPKVMLVKSISGIKKFNRDSLIFFTGHMSTYEKSEKDVKELFNLV